MAELQTTLHDIAAAIVDSPDEVKVTCEESDDAIVLTLNVAPDDMGMVIGLMPGGGMPLPFISYGGSATIVNFTLVGIVLNVSMRRFMFKG